MNPRGNFHDWNVKMNGYNQFWKDWMDGKGRVTLLKKLPHWVIENSEENDL